MPIQMPNKNSPKKPTNWSKVSKQLSFWVFVILVPVAITSFGAGRRAGAGISYTEYSRFSGQYRQSDDPGGRALTGDSRPGPAKGGRPFRSSRCPAEENSSDDLKS